MVIVHILYSILEGGVAAVALQLIYEQASNGHKVIVVSCDNPASLRKKIPSPIFEFYQTGFLNCKYPSIFGIMNNRVLVQIKKKYASGDIVFHYHNPVARGLFMSPKTNNSICTIHGHPSTNNTIPLAIWKRTIRKMIKNNYKIVGVSEEMSNYLQSIFSVSFHCVHNGVSIVAAGDNHYQLDNNLFNIVFVGFLDDLKGWQYVAEAYLLLPEQIRKKATLNLVGQDSDETQQLLKTKYNYDGIKYHGVLSDLRECFLPYCHLLVLPSRNEGLPMSIIEALASSIPVIGTNVGGIPEIIINGYNGFFCERDSQNISSIIANIIEDDNLYKILKTNAFNTYSKKFTSDKMYAGYCFLYLECISAQNDLKH